MGCIGNSIRLRRRNSASKKADESNLVLPPCCLAMSGPSNLTQEPLFAPSTDPEAVQPGMLPANEVEVVPAAADEQPSIVVDDVTEEADANVDCPLPHHKRKKPFGYKICGFFQCLINQFPIPCRICCYLWCPCCIPCPLGTEQTANGEPNVNVNAEARVNVSSEPTVSTTVENSQFLPDENSASRTNIAPESMY
ncbi:MAG: hypothetical protein SEPTF4163_001964 [Sporothrix epigloea]